MVPLAVSLWELRVVFTLGRSVIYSRERNARAKRRRKRKKIGDLVSCDVSDALYAA